MSFSPFPSPSRSLLAAFSFSLTFSSTKTKGSPTSTLLLSQSSLLYLIYCCQPFRHPLVVSLYASCKILRRRCGVQDSPFSVFFFITTHFLFRDCFDRIAFVVVHFHWMVEGTYLVHISYLSRTHLVPISYTSRTYLVHISHLSCTFQNFYYYFQNQIVTPPRRNPIFAARSRVPSHVPQWNHRNYHCFCSFVNEKWERKKKEIKGFVKMRKNGIRIERDRKMKYSFWKWENGGRRRRNSINCFLGFFYN